MNTRKSIIVAVIAAATGIGGYANGAYAQSGYANNASDATETQSPAATEAPGAVADDWAAGGCWICNGDITLPETPEDAQLSGVQNINDEVGDFGADPCPPNKNSTTCDN